ncbi:hypothetical protein ACS127_14640 [Amphibacillus sp. Q70]|uniref:hypothetical protein n=1 Tax=Amphibacillus sp. Q70 TaxID=3453416 RepID=UPI003F83E396
MDQEQEDNKVIKQLNNLPKIEDQQSKALLYEKIDQTMNGVKVAKKYNHYKWFVPSIATAAIAILIVIMIQTGMFNHDQLAEQSNNMRNLDDQEMGTMNTLEDTDEEEELEQDDTGDLEGDVETFDGYQEDESAPSKQLVYYNNQQDFSIYNIAVVDQQNMYAIPISLVDTSSTGEGDPNDVYNRMLTFIDEEEYGVDHFPFDEVEFDFSDDYQTIDMIVADDYQFPQGSSWSESFQEMINFMFADFPADELNLRTGSTDYIDLGAFGEISTLEIEPVHHLAYKLYQYEGNEDNERLLVPIKQNMDSEQFFTIDEAFREMQYDQTDFSITGTIPSNVEFEVDPSDQDLLRIDFASHSLFGDNRMTKEMIESILMTAKSFDFQLVEISIEGDLIQVDEFDLTEPIPVPDGVNPKLLH